MEENELDAVIDGEGMRDENINISDVIEVIETDPDFPKESSNNQANASNTMYNGGGEVPNYVPPNPTQSQSQPRSSGRSGYEIKILEQPAPKALRFRYECEGRSAGSIPGASSTPENKTFPTIKVVGGPPRRAVVVVSCVTKDDFRPHPHNLVGREGCKKGVCTLEIPPETMTVSFSNLGIQCVKKKDIEAALRVREEIRVDPYRTGFSHRNQPTTIDLNAVRLCFQVFLENESQKGKFTVQLPPKVSEPIYDKKAMSDLNIIKLSDCVSYVDGGRKDIILLCEKVAKEDIQVRFYEKKDGQIVWEAFADIQPSQVHKQHAIWFRTPRYKTLDVTDKVPVFIQLRRPSDGATSEALPFELLPLDSGIPKKKRTLDSSYSELLGEPSTFLQVPTNNIKHEPRETHSPFYGGFPNVSPQSYNPSPSPDPHVYAHSPEMTYNLPFASPMNITQQAWDAPGPSTSKSPNLEPTWNIPQGSNNPSPIQVTQNWTGNNVGNSTLLDLDNHQINSADLNIPMSQDMMPDLNNLSLSDIVPDHNTTDSLTRIVNNAAENMLNN